jgi:hypothetical protein
MIVEYPTDEELAKAKEIEESGAFDEGPSTQRQL